MSQIEEDKYRNENSEYLYIIRRTDFVKASEIYIFYPNKNATKICE